MAQRVSPTDNPMREVRPVVQRFYELYPPCVTDGCYDIADTRSAYCDRCSSNREFEARLAAKRAARLAGR